MLPRISLLPGIVQLIGVLLISVASGGSALAEYPFDPMMSPGPDYAHDAYGMPDGYGYNDGYGYDEGYNYGDYGYDEGYGYGPDPALYELDDPFGGGELFGVDDAIWPGFLSGTIQPGTDRTIGGGEWFQPLYQDGQTLWYFDFRGQADSDSASEFNVGTGVRTLTAPGWIFGAYGFWDHLNSANGNTFNQGMIGLEAMDVFWDVRFNVYFPESGAESVGSPRARVSNGNVVVQSSVERAYWGMDFEVGNLLWAWGPVAEYEVRGFLGGYYFDHSAPGTESIAGPRARLEWRWYDLPYFGPGSRLECGVSVQTDQVRDGQLFGFARMRIPLDPWAHDRQRMTPLHRRMLDHVVRDVDVVSAVTRSSERAVNADTGRLIRGYHRIDADTQFVGDVLDGTDEDALIVVDGRAGEIVLPHTFDLKIGQTVIGGGSSLTVRGARSNRRATFEAEGTRPTIVFDGNAHIAWKRPAEGAESGFAPNGPMTTTLYVEDTSSEWVLGQFIVPNPPGFRMRDRTQLVGIDLTGARGGVKIHHASDVAVLDVAVTDFGGAGIDVDDAHNVTLDSVRVSDAKPAYNDLDTTLEDASEWGHPDARPQGVGILVRDSRDVSIQNSSVRNTTAEGIRIVDSKDVEVQWTSVRDTKRDGIRLVETEDVLLEDLELKNVGSNHTYATDDDEEMDDDSRPIAGIALKSTYDTQILDSSIQGSQGIGIYGNGADKTRIDGMHISKVSQGILFQNSNDVHIANTTIVLANHAANYVVGTTSLAGDVDAPFGLLLDQVENDVVVTGNQIHAAGGRFGIALFADGAGTTDLDLSNNVVDGNGLQEGLTIEAGEGHDFAGSIADNNLAGSLHAVDLVFAGSGTNSAELVRNQLGGKFNVTLMDAAAELGVADNHLVGSPLGRIFTNGDSALELVYRNNTSAPGASAIQFENDGGTFNADVRDNDHQPQQIGIAAP